MRRIENVDFGKLSRLQETAPGADREVVTDRMGYPADRSICPACVWERDANCTVCHGTGVVCPKCRGARVLRDANASTPFYRGCWGCTDWTDSTQHEWGSGGAHNWPVFSRVIDREAAAIHYYRKYSRDRDVDMARRETW